MQMLRNVAHEQIEYLSGSADIRDGLKISSVNQPRPTIALASGNSGQAVKVLKITVVEKRLRSMNKRYRAAETK